MTPKWKAGDLFFMSVNPGKIWRVHRVKGQTVWFLANHYGRSPPRGILQKSYTGQSAAWKKVERDYR